MKKLLRRLLNRRNLLALVTVVIGLLSLFGVPQDLGLTSEQVILGLLSFIALEAIVVNIGYLESLRDFSEEMRARVIQPSLDSLLAPRRGRFDLADFKGEVKDVLICGVSLEGIAMSQANLIAELLGKGCRFRFVLISPEASFLDRIDLRMSNYVGEEVIRANIRAGIARLAQLYRSLEDKQRERMKVRSYAGIPFFSAVRLITDIEASDVIWISYFTYGGATGERRGVLIHSDTSPETFSFYDRSLAQLWRASDGVDLDTFAF
jgi:hypothetical protein